MKGLRLVFILTLTAACGRGAVYKNSSATARTVTNGNGDQKGGSTDITEIVDTGEVQPVLMGEVGITTLNNNISTITFKNHYDNPVILLAPLSQNGTNTAQSVIQSIDKENGNFTVRIVETSANRTYDGGIHVDEKFAYYIMEEGSYKFENGKKFVVGSTGEISQSSGNGLFESTFIGIGIGDGFRHTAADGSDLSVFHSVQRVVSCGASPWMSSISLNATNWYISVALAVEDAVWMPCRGELGFAVFESHVGEWMGQPFEVGHIQGALDGPANGGFTPFEFLATYEDKPDVIMASLNSQNDPRSVNLRTRYGSSGTLTKTQFEMRAMADSENGDIHPGENLSFMTFDAIDPAGEAMTGVVDLFAFVQ